MNYLGINHVLLGVTDLERALHFWRDLVGLPPHPRISRWLMINRCTLHFLPLPEVAPESSAFRRFQHVAFQVNDLARAWADLTRAGLKPFQLELNGQETVVERPDQLDTGSGTIFIRDPDGNLAEFIQIGRGMFAQEADPFSGSIYESRAGFIA